MRAVGFVAAATAGGCRLSDLDASHRSFLFWFHGVVICLARRQPRQSGRGRL